MTKTELTCINCPIGCFLTAWIEDGKVVKVEGNNCPRGDRYARQEVVNPLRTVTSSVAVEGDGKPRVSVKTVPEIPKGMIFPVMEIIRATRAQHPVKIGDVLVTDIAGTGSDLLATSNS